MSITCSGSTMLYLLLGLVVLSKQVSAQCTEGICGANALPDPTRKVFEEGNAVVTCEELETQAASDSSLCPGLSNYAFYCGCPDAEPPCSLCSKGSLVEFPSLDIGKYRPAWFPADETYDCDIVQKITSLESQCNAGKKDRQDIANLCGCDLPELWNCTTVCPDGTLVDPAYQDVQVLQNHPFYEDYTCGELELFVSEGYFWSEECDSVNYMGVKLCGCQESRSYCDLCEDGSVPVDMNKDITYFKTCFEYAGDAFFLDVNSETCKAIRGSAGVYCGCNNPLSTDGACRVCDDPGGLVVPDHNLTISVGEGDDAFLADCGELELVGSDPGNEWGFTCDDMQLFGKDLCCLDFSPQPTANIVTPPPTVGATPPPTVGATPPPTVGATPPPTVGATPPPTVGTTPPPTVGATPPPTVEAGQASPPLPTATPTAGSTVTGASGVPGEGCTICGTGVTLPFPDRMIYQEGFNNVTCSSLESAASSNSTLCPDLASYSFYCGCPGIDPVCSTCTGGGQVSADFDSLVLKGMAPSWFPADVNFTCGDAQRIFSVANSSSECLTDYAPYDTLCGCYAPANNNCTSLCPDGTLIDPMYSDTLVVEGHPFLGTMTCSEFQLLVAQGDLWLHQCDSANYAGIKYCGCAQTVPFCELCEDGSPPLFLEREITYAKTCLDHAGDGYFVAPDDPMCPTFQATYGEYCGCNNPIASAGVCRVCDVPGGEGVPDSNYTITIDGDFVDCGELEFAANVPGSQFTCENATALGAECCSVTIAPTAAPERCTICVGTLPFPDRVILMENGENATCGSLEAAALANDTFCDGLSDYAFYCGCPGEVSSCPLCPDGSLSPKPDLLLKGLAPSWLPSDVNYTCQLEEQLRSLQATPAQCNAATTGMDDLPTLCGCSVPDQSSCSSLCPDGTLIDPIRSNVAVFEGDPNLGNVTCADYQMMAAVGDMNLAECDAAHYVGIKICGCSETRPFCDLCEDGSVVPDLTKEVTFGKTCLDHAADAYFTDPGNDKCLALQASYGEYCSCNNPIAGIGACRICPGGLPVPNSNITVKIGDFSVDCGNLEFTGNDPAADFTCVHVTAFGTECCAPTNEPVETPPPSPNPAPSREPPPEPPAPPPNGALFTPPSVAAGRDTALWLVGIAFLSTVALFL